MKKNINIIGSLLTSIIFISSIFTNALAQEEILIFQADYKNREIIHGNAGEDKTLFFGDSLSHSLQWNGANGNFIFSDDVSFEDNQIKNVRIENLSSAPNCNNTEIGHIYHNTTDKKTYICDGNTFNILENENNFSLLIPFISNTTPFSLFPHSTRTISIDGSSFTPTTIVSIPGFDGSIDNINIISTTQIEITLTPGNTKTNYNIILSNQGTLNTLWSGNGVNLLQVLDNNGASNTTPGQSCKQIVDDGYSNGNGIYWIDPNGGQTSDSFQVECDMTTDGGGWTKIPYAQDLPHQNHGTGTDSRRWLNNNFILSFTDTQINDIRSVSTEGKQQYQGTCDGVIHYKYNGGNNYNNSFGFRYHDGFETEFGPSVYPTYDNTNITVTADGCATNNSSSGDTIFEIRDVRVPVINVSSSDNGDAGELFGSPLTQHPAWLR